MVNALQGGEGVSSHTLSSGGIRSQASKDVSSLLSDYESRLVAWEECKKFLSPAQINAVQITRDSIYIFGIKIKLDDESEDNAYTSEGVLTREEWTKILSLTYGSFALQDRFLGDVLGMNLKAYYWTSTEGPIDDTAYYFGIPVGVINTMTPKTQRLRVRKRA